MSIKTIANQSLLLKVWPRSDFQFASPQLAELQIKEMLWAKKQAEYQVPLREPQGDADTPEVLEDERKAEQDKVDAGAHILLP